MLLLRVAVLPLSKSYLIFFEITLFGLITFVKLKKKKKDLLAVLCRFMLFCVTNENHSIHFSYARALSWSMLHCDQTHVIHKFRMLICFSSYLFDTFLCRFQNTKTKRFNWSKTDFLSSFFKTNFL